VKARLDRDRSTIPLELERDDNAGNRYPNLLEQQPSHEPDPFEIIERIEERRMVEAARDRLSPKQARVVDLYLAGVDPGETRRRLVCTRENVNYLLHRAGERIRAVLPFLRRTGTPGRYAIPSVLPN
jgi:DNA-directed RNA polymerase specialized sigma24 family protein